MSNLCWSVLATVAFIPGQEIELPAPMPSPGPAVMLPAKPVPLSLCDFAKVFQPTPGRHEVLFLHPVKKCPVLVCFDLPSGCPKVRVHRREIVLDYGCECVTIRFKLLGGKVAVLYD